MTTAFPSAMPTKVQFSAPYLVLLVLMLFAGNCRAQTTEPLPSPLNFSSKPATRSYLSQTPAPIEADLLKAPMIPQLAGLKAIIAPRSIVKLRRSLSKHPIAPTRIAEFDDSPPIAWLHLHRGNAHRAHAIYRQDQQTLILLAHDLAHDSTRLAWTIDAKAFDELGISLSETPTPSIDLQTQDTQRHILPSPAIRSATTLDRRTVQARIKRNYPPLNTEPRTETFRCRIPKDFNPEFPAGVLVWISPSLDGRIPKVFEPILDKLGFIAIGVDHNGNDRTITDRLQNHLDSIATLNAHYLIDHNRIYLTGMSGGGKCSTILQIAFPDLFAGAVPIVGMDSYHKVPTGEPGLFWPAGVGKPASRWMNLLKQRRIAAITGSIDFNEPEMNKRAELLERDRIKVRLETIEGMGHTMPTSEQFADALDWVDQPRRKTMVANFKQAKELMATYTDDFGNTQPSTPAARKTLIKIITLAPWTEPAWNAAQLLGYEQNG